MTLCAVCRINFSNDIRRGTTRFCSKACKSFYSRYLDMRRRATSAKHKQFKDYGGAGRGICEQWMSFDEFRKDMLPSFYHSVATKGLENTTLDRINNELGYSKANCRWATPTLQCYNRQKWRKPCSSKYIGVTRRNNGRWRARITISGRRKDLGEFKTEEEARDAYRAAFESLVIL